MRFPCGMDGPLARFDGEWKNFFDLAAKYFVLASKWVQANKARRAVAALFRFTGERQVGRSGLRHLEPLILSRPYDCYRFTLSGAASSNTARPTGRRALLARPTGGRCEASGREVKQTPLPLIQRQLNLTHNPVSFTQETSTPSAALTGCLWRDCG